MRELILRVLTAANVDETLVKRGAAVDTGGVGTNKQEWLTDDKNCGIPW